jgi:hypothetical protein
LAGTLTRISIPPSSRRQWPWIGPCGRIRIRAEAGSIVSMRASVVKPHFITVPKA